MRNMVFRASRSESPAMILFPMPKSIVIRGAERSLKVGGISPCPTSLLPSSFDCSIVLMFDYSIVSLLLLTSPFLVLLSLLSGWKQKFSPWSSSSSWLWPSVLVWTQISDFTCLCFLLFEKFLFVFHEDTWITSKMQRILITKQYRTSSCKSNCFFDKNQFASLCKPIPHKWGPATR